MTARSGSAACRSTNATNASGGAGTGGSRSGSGEPAEGPRERRLRLDPDQLQQEQRIADAEVAAAAAIERLIEERLAVKDVAQLTGLDQATVCRLRQLETDTNEGGTNVEDAETELS